MKPNRAPGARLSIGGAERRQLRNILVLTPLGMRVEVAIHL
jgi:hypothetical protein